MLSRCTFDCVLFSFFINIDYLQVEFFVGNLPGDLEDRTEQLTEFFSEHGIEIARVNSKPNKQ